MSRGFEIVGESIAVLKRFPYSWIPCVQLFDSDIPGFPLHRIHVENRGERVFGFPAWLKVDEKHGDGTCDVSIGLMMNRPLEDLPSVLRESFCLELEERLGFRQALSIDDILNCCQPKSGPNNKKYERWAKLVRLIFPRLAAYYGDRIPYGRFFDRTYAIFRLCSTWNVPSGQKQEIIMTSNLMKTAGESPRNTTGMHVNMGLLPTYEELLEDRVEEFPRFVRVRNAVMQFGDKHLTSVYEVHSGIRMHVVDTEKEVPGGSQGQRKWDTLLSELDEDNRRVLNQIKEDMNRMYQRPIVLMVYLYNVLKGLDFGAFRGEDYAKVCNDRARTTYPKVLGMLLQQAWANPECIPIDIWVESFFETLLDTPAKAVPTSGRNLGKFERFVWYTVQLRKTNQPLFSDILHCIKTGVLKSESIQMRKPNPLSCSLCSLSREGCPVFASLSRSLVVIIDGESLTAAVGPALGGGESIRLETPAKSADDYEKAHLLPKAVFEFGELPSIDFIIVKRAGIASSVYVPKTEDRNVWIMVDDMSAFTTDVKLNRRIASVEDIALGQQ